MQQQKIWIQFLLFLNCEQKGDQIVLINFEDKIEYEGRNGWIIGEFNEEKGRWPVRLNFNNKRVNVLPLNLTLEVNLYFFLYFTQN